VAAREQAGLADRWSVAPRAAGRYGVAGGASVGVRYMMNEVAHGLALDSGAVDVRETVAVITVVARGTGIETAVGARGARGVVRLGAARDGTVSCRSGS